MFLAVQIKEGIKEVIQLFRITGRNQLVNFREIDQFPDFVQSVGQAIAVDSQFFRSGGHVKSTIKPSLQRVVKWCIV